MGEFCLLTLKTWQFGDLQFTQGTKINPMKIEQKLNLLLRTEQVLNLWSSLYDGKITFKSLAFSKIDYVEKWLD